MWSRLNLLARLLVIIIPVAAVFASQNLASSVTEGRSVEIIRGAISPSVLDILTEINELSDPATTLEILKVLRDLTRSNSSENESECSCALTSISTPTTINESGSYCLSNNINGPIIINASQVTLDLYGFTITNTTNGIVINTGLSSVAVSNGFINNMTNQAIIVGDGSTLITLKDLEISGVGELSNVFAVDFQGSATGITDCLVQNITISMAAGGIQLSSVDSTKVIDCRILDCSVPNFLNAIAVTGFNGSGIPCTANEIINCRAERLDSPQGVTALFFIIDQGTVVDQTYVCSLSSSAGPVIAMQSLGSEELLIQNCSIAVLSSSLQAQGIFLFGVGQSIIQDCTIAGVYIDNPQPLSYANAIEVVGIQGSIKNVVIADIGLDSNMASTSVGIFLNPVSSNFVIQNCTVVDVAGSDQAIGFQIGGSNTILEGCQANSVAADTNAYGFLLGPLTNCTISNCIALSIAATGIGMGMSAGFNLQIDSGIITDCTAQAILSSDPTSTAYGFVTLVGTNSLILDQCIANDISGGAQGVGFELEGEATYVRDSQVNNVASTGAALGIDIRLTTTGCIVENCRVTNSGIGINNSGFSSTVFDCFASRNGTNYAGVIPAPVALGSPTLNGNNISA